MEEKVAHDAYVVLGTTFDAVLFDNIAEGEARHQETVAGLLTKHGIANPTTGDAFGVFDDAAVQSRYNDLVARARTSLKSALEVGVLIEESEIRILTGILATTVPRDVRQVATNLLDGERNHLAAFQSALANVRLLPSRRPSLPAVSRRPRSVRRPAVAYSRGSTRFCSAARPGHDRCGCHAPLARDHREPRRLHRAHP